MSHIGMIRNKIDLWIFYKWIPDKSIAFVVSWIDDLLNIGFYNAIKCIKWEIKSLFNYSNKGEMKEYVRCKIEYNHKRKSLKMTHPVIIQSFKDEFNLPKKNPITLMPAGYITKRGKENELISKEK